MNYTEINKKKREISAELSDLFDDTMRLISRRGLSAEKKAENELKIQANDDRTKKLWQELSEVGR